MKDWASKRSAQSLRTDLEARCGPCGFVPWKVTLRKNVILFLNLNLRDLDAFRTLWQFIKEQSHYIYIYITMGLFLWSRVS